MITDTDGRQGDRMKLNIRGVKYEVRLSTLQAIPETLLAQLDRSSKYWDPCNGEYFFERDPDVFNAILNYYITRELHMPKHVCAALFRKELEFWKISFNNVAECCWRSFYQIDEDLEVLEDLKKVVPILSDKLPPGGTYDNNRLGYRIWVTLDNPKSSRKATVWNAFYLTIVAVSTMVFFLGSLDELRTDLYLSKLDRRFLNESGTKIPNKKLRIYYVKDPIPVLFALDLFCLLVFTVELILNFWLCDDKRKFLRRPMKLVTIVLVTFMWVSFVMEFYKAELVEMQPTAVVYMIVRFLTVLRVLLFLRLESQFSAFRVLIFVIRSSLKELLLLCITFGIATIIFACAIFYAEIFDESAYNNLFIAMWWAVVTMSTVGYGDTYPTTTVGYVVGVVCAICGLLLLAMPVAIIASNFSDYYTRNKDRIRHFRTVKGGIRTLKRRRDTICASNNANHQNANNTDHSDSKNLRYIGKVENH